MAGGSTGGAGESTTVTNCQMGTTSDDYCNKVLKQHNDLRRTLVTAGNMVEMTWDSDLAAVAQAFVEAGKPNGPHNSQRTSEYRARGGSGYVGENWYSGKPFDAAEKWCTFVWPKSWGGNGCSEEQNYWATLEGSTPKGQQYSQCAGGTVGHYTQVLWATSVRVGCGWTQQEGTICNYSPGGNSGNSFRKKGATCSSCPAAFPVCNNGLCSTSLGGGENSPTKSPTNSPTNLGSNPTRKPTRLPTRSPTKAPVNAGGNTWAGGNLKATHFWDW